MLKIRWSATLFCCALFFSGWATARPVNQPEVLRAAENWLSLTPVPLCSPIGSKLSVPTPVTDFNGATLCYVVQAEPQGFIVMSSDDELEPILAFSAHGHWDEQQNSALLDLLRKDIPIRQANQNNIFKSRAGSAKTEQLLVGTTRHSKWARLLSMGQENQAAELAANEFPAQEMLDDPRVDSIVPTQWGQTDAGGGYCYNYFTPNHDVSGCVATALAQVIRTHRYPISGIGSQLFDVTVDGVKQKLATRGGDGHGGPYDWDEMPPIISAGSVIPESQRSMIGALLYDCGLSVNMDYAPGGSGSSVLLTSSALTHTFGYSSAVDFHDDYSDVHLLDSDPADFHKTINACLDGGYPVLLSVFNPAYGHAVVCDGYGYNWGSIYYHINFGWDGGSNDLWYNLPVMTIPSGAGSLFNVVNGWVYNIFPVGSGEIISGRVTDESGKPLDGVAVSNGSISATTNARGIYALAPFPAGTYTVTATKAGYQFPILPNQVVQASVGGRPASAGHAQLGNLWGVDFQAYTPTAPKIVGFTPSMGAVGMTVTLTGSGFTGTSSVSFGSIATTALKVVNDTTLTVTIPSQAITGTISVVNPAGKAVSLTNFQVIPAADLYACIPSRGGVGTLVTISGHGFTGTSAVLFGGVAAQYSIVSDSELTAIVPSDVADLSLVLHTPGGILNARFDVSVGISSMSPLSGFPGTVVAIQGSGFRTIRKLSMSGGGNLPFSLLDSGTLQFTVPKGAASGPVTLDQVCPPGSAGGQVFSTDSFTVTAAPSPILSGFSPSSGKAGDSVTLTGRYFTAANAVSFGGVPASSFSIVGDQTIVVVVPVNAATGPISVSSTTGVCQSSSNFFIYEKSTISGLSPAIGPVGSTVVISGSKFTSVSSVGFFGGGSSWISSTFSIDSDSQISATVPVGARTGPVQIIGPGGVVLSDMSFSVVPAPNVLSFAPKQGLPGCAIVIVGSGFNGAQSVSINSIAVKGFSIDSDGQITFTLPADALSGVISVTNSYGDGRSSSVFNVLSLDLNGDHVGDLGDLAILARAFGSNPVHDAFDSLPIADLNGDDIVDERDVLLYFGKK